eukprot:scaffold59398_cov69-Phaeocystis_antarctica.AAC.7
MAARPASLPTRLSSASHASSCTEASAGCARIAAAIGPTQPPVATASSPSGLKAQLPSTRHALVGVGVGVRVRARNGLGLGSVSAGSAAMAASTSGRPRARTAASPSPMAQLPSAEQPYACTSVTVGCAAIAAATASMPS